MCREQKVPIIYGLTMSKLGLISKTKGTKVAVLGVLKYIGNEEFFKTLIENAEDARKKFYEKNSGKLEELKLNKFLVGSVYLQPKKDN